MTTSKFTFPFNNIDPLEVQIIHDLLKHENIIAAQAIKKLHTTYGAPFCASLEVTLEKMYQDVSTKLQPLKKQHTTPRTRKNKLLTTEEQVNLLATLENIVRIKKIFRDEFTKENTKRAIKSRM